MPLASYGPGMPGPRRTAPTSRRGVLQLLRWCAPAQHPIQPAPALIQHGCRAGGTGARHAHARTPNSASRSRIPPADFTCTRGAACFCISTRLRWWAPLPYPVDVFTQTAPNSLEISSGGSSARRSNSSSENHLQLFVPRVGHCDNPPGHRGTYLPVAAQHRAGCSLPCPVPARRRPAPAPLRHFDGRGVAAVRKAMVVLAFHLAACQLCAHRRR